MSNEVEQNSNEARARADRIRAGFEGLSTAEAEALYAWALSLDIDNEAREVLSDGQ